jgi:predicted component of type VI protein secretion system
MHYLVIVILLALLSGCSEKPKEFKRVLMIRSDSLDFEADYGVVPTPREADQFGIEVYYLKSHHTDMTDKGSPETKREINKAVKKFLDEMIVD